MSENTTSLPAGDAELAAQFLSLNTHLSGGENREVALHRLVQLAVDVIPGCDWAAVTAWPERQRPRTLAASHSVAVAADQWQYDTGEGPCLSAAVGSEAMVIPDLGAEDRWPKFAAAAADGAVHSVLSFRVVEQPVRTALNLYSGRPGAFDPEALTYAALFAAHARVLFLHADSTEKAAQLSSALTTSRQIGAAIGILMNVHRITADQAFQLLRDSSQHLNRKLSDIAGDVTHTGSLPELR